MLQIHLQSTFKGRPKGFILRPALPAGGARDDRRTFVLYIFTEVTLRWNLLPSSQIHLVCELRLWPALHPERGSPSVRPGPGALSADRRGPAAQHLAPLQNPVGLPTPPSAAELQEHNHHLPQEDQRRLLHGAELRQPPASQTLPLQCGAGGRRRASGPCGSSSVAPRGWLRWSAVFVFFFFALRLV